MYRAGSARDWHRDVPDPRDYTHRHDEVVKALIELVPQTELPSRVDWREYCGRVEDQQPLRASCAFSCASLMQYFERRATGALSDPAKLFIYRTSRRLMGLSGDSGVTLRGTWKAIACFGAPDTEHWPYDATRVNDDPDAFAYSAARHIDQLSYHRLDARGQAGAQTLYQVRSYLAAGLPCVFGFPTSSNLLSTAEIPIPTLYDAIGGGLAAMAVGYDDNRSFRSYRGALLIRTSWGSEWGEQGHGWLPYAYVREELAADFWTILSPRWLSSGEFMRPRLWD